MNSPREPRLVAVPVIRSQNVMHMDGLLSMDCVLGTILSGLGVCYTPHNNPTRIVSFADEEVEAH